MAGSRPCDEGEACADATDPSLSRGVLGTRPIGLTRRTEFQRASRGRRAHARCLGLQIFKRPDDEAGVPRFGLTVTKRVGNAVERNRIKRRFRDVLRRLDMAPPAGHDYVIVARREALHAAFSSLVADVVKALAQADGSRGPARRGKPRGPNADASPSSGGSAPANERR